MQISFVGTKDFEAYSKAEQWLKENGYHCGPMQRDDQVGIAKEDWIICYKWRNLYPAGKALLDGFICSGDKRYGPVSIIIFDATDPSPYKTAETESIIKGAC